MDIYNLTTNIVISANKKKWYNHEDSFLIVCNANEMKYFDAMFKFDPSTILECINLDENVRFESYNGYDFISLIYFNIEDKHVVFSEINLYVGCNYIFLVLPAKEKIYGNFTNFLRYLLMNNPPGPEGLTILYYKILQKIVTELFSGLEAYENIILEIELAITEKASKEQLSRIIDIKSVTNHIKKILRAFIYIGDSLIINENNFIPENKMKFFVNIDSRMNKLYGFAETINDMALQLIHLYDSKIGMQTNEIVTRLTLLTVFIGPLTVITGVYGMNFAYMPELDFLYGYPLVILIMIILTVSLYIYLKKSKKWRL